MMIYEMRRKIGDGVCVDLCGKHSVVLGKVLLLLSTQFHHRNLQDCVECWTKRSLLIIIGHMLILERFVPSSSFNNSTFFSLITFLPFDGSILYAEGTNVLIDLFIYLFLFLKKKQFEPFFRPYFAQENIKNKKKKEKDPNWLLKECTDEELRKLSEKSLLLFHVFQLLRVRRRIIIWEQHLLNEKINGSCSCSLVLVLLFSETKKRLKVITIFLTGKNLIALVREIRMNFCKEITGTRSPYFRSLFVLLNLFVSDKVNKIYYHWWGQRHLKPPSLLADLYLDVQQRAQLFHNDYFTTLITY